mgnify:CR=1 FL=1
MKKILIFIVLVVLGIFIWKHVNKPSGIKVMGYKGLVTDVVNGNTIVLNTGLKVWMLGVEPNRERAETWIRNNLVGKMVELVSETRFFCIQPVMPLVSNQPAKTESS